MSRRRRVLKVVKWVVIVSLLALLWAAWPGRSTFTISPETTYVTGPVDKDGYIDYVTALNERLRGDIKPEENANVLIWQALGPRPEGELPAQFSDVYFHWLGVEPPKSDGEYWVGYLSLMRKRKEAEWQEDSVYFRELEQTQMKPWTEKDHPRIGEWLRVNEKPLSVVRQAVKRSRYYNPLFAIGESEMPKLVVAWLPNVQRCRDVGSALTVRCMLRISSGDSDGAWDDLMTCCHLGRLLARGGTSIEYLVGVALDSLGCKTMIRYLEHISMTSDAAKRRLANFARLPPMPPMADKFDLGERFTVLESLQSVARDLRAAASVISRGDRLPSDENRFMSRLFTRSVDWDPAFRNANKLYGRCAEIARLSDRLARRREIDQLIKQLDAKTDDSFRGGFFRNFFLSAASRGERVGDILLGMMIRALESVRSTEDRIDQTHRNLHLAFALAAYRADHKRYPATLAELAPKYIDKIPDDLFSGQALIYKLQDDGYLLYSVGQNSKDDGGQSFDDTPRGDDLVVRMPAPKKGPKID